MTEATLRNMLDELLTELYLPTIEESQDGPDKTFEGGDPESGIRDEANLVEQSLDRLRVGIKYMMFDLEATRRENRCLRRLIEQQAMEEEDIDLDGETA